MIRAAVSVVCCLLLAAPAAAERDFGLYLGGGGLLVAAKDQDVFEKDLSYRVAEFVGGAYWRWLGLEMRAGQGLANETVRLNPAPGEDFGRLAETSLDNYTSYYLRLQYDHDVAHAYTLIGSTTLNSSSYFPDDNSVSRNISSGMSWGLGLGLKVSKRVHASLEYRSLVESDIDTFTGIGFNLLFRF
ncbi:outer membrane beta-barrel protein [Agaribacterium haliotis]|uniref:outer membrane beta-barrel protein n=1 Tax=Agaribacterium haliotis TaxID=2013869 RepID=UPI000BB58B20|nr:outer membrane beta-barrel protein [Agaribacterium haliotis]